MSTKNNSVQFRGSQAFAFVPMLIFLVFCIIYFVIFKVFDMNALAVGGFLGLLVGALFTKTYDKYWDAALNGIVFSSVFILYQLTSLVFVFAATALFFGVMAVLGYTTNADFSRLRPFLLGGLLFLAAFWILSIFINLAQFEMIACTVGIFLFLVITAYDTRKIRDFYQIYAGKPEMAAKASIFAALELYLDLINLFLYLVRVLGRRK